jgi:Fe-S cluster biogenesis protein NfuA
VDLKNKEQKMKTQVEQALDQIRPGLQMDGGDIELISVDGTTVKVKLMGACGSCPMSKMTMKNGVERIVKELVPEITDVIAV